MAYAKRAQSAYDGNAARVLEPERQIKKQPQIERRKLSRDNLIRLTEKELRHARRKNINPLKVAALMVCTAVIFSLVAYSVYGQVQLTELTESINETTTQLSQLQSVEVQLQMQATSNMNVPELEEYAKNDLGMEKINSEQITYVNLATADKGTVIVEDSKNIFEKLLAAIGF